MARKDPIGALVRSSPPPSDTHVAEVRALGAAALPRLRALLLDPDGGGPADTPAVRGALNAAWVLGALPGGEASALLVEAFVAAPAESPLAGTLGFSLARRGPEVVEPLLALRDGPRDAEALAALVRRGPGRGEAPDARVTAWIAARIADAPAVGAALALDWPAPALVAPLHAAFDVLYAPAGPVGDRAQVLNALLGAAVACGAQDLRRLQNLHARLVEQVRTSEGEVAALRAVQAHLGAIIEGS